MNIQFFTEDITYELLHKEEISKWIASVIHDESHQLEELNYIFCSDDYLLNINKEYLDHDYFTDIITFDNSDDPKLICSDIFISLDRVGENAKQESVAFEHELCRVMVHGVLHLLGYGDKTDSEKRVMREKENACLSLLQIKVPRGT